MFPHLQCTFRRKDLIEEKLMYSLQKSFWQQKWACHFINKLYIEFEINTHITISTFNVHLTEILKYSFILRKINETCHV